jgi:hypothetical protein
MSRFAVPLALALLVPGASHAVITLSNSSPRVFETVRVQLASGAAGFGLLDEAATRITMANNKIVVTLKKAVNSIDPPPPSQPIDLSIGQFPRGVYDVEVVLDGAADTLGSAGFEVSSAVTTVPPLNHSDLWWNPNESGWGLNVIQHGSGKLFATWFVYGADGKPTWYVIPDGQWNTLTDYYGEVYRTTGPVVAGTFDPSRVSVTHVGTAHLNFLAIDYATLDLTFDRGHSVKEIRPQSF